MLPTPAAFLVLVARLLTRLLKLRSEDHGDAESPAASSPMSGSMQPHVLLSGPSTVPPHRRQRTAATPAASAASAAWEPFESSRGSDGERFALRRQ